MCGLYHAHARYCMKRPEGARHRPTFSAIHNGSGVCEHRMDCSTRAWSHGPGCGSRSSAAVETCCTTPAREFGMNNVPRRASSRRVRTPTSSSGIPTATDFRIGINDKQPHETWTIRGRGLRRRRQGRNGHVAGHGGGGAGTVVAGRDTASSSSAACYDYWSEHHGLRPSSSRQHTGLGVVDF